MDSFYRKHADELERARRARSAAPAVAADARRAAERAEAQLTKAEQDGFGYPSVMDAAGELITAVAALNAATGPGPLRQAAGAVHAAVELVEKRIASARELRRPWSTR